MTRSRTTPSASLLRPSHLRATDLIAGRRRSVMATTFSTGQLRRFVSGEYTKEPALL